jgi:glycosyltransferase involved in cell wall biosynthesis
MSATPVVAEKGECLHVLVPCMNEAGNVARCVEEVLAFAAQVPMELRVILIDDGSTDATRAEMERLAAADPRCELRLNERNRGLGRSVMATVAELPPKSWVTVFPGDNEFVFASLRNYLAVRADHDLILGYLHNPIVRTLGRRLASYAFTKVVSTLYGFSWRYLNGMKMYRAEVFQGLEIISSGHAFMAEAIAKAQLRRPDLRIGEVAFYSRGRGGGRSKAIRPRSIFRAMAEVWRGARSVARYRKQVVGAAD